MGGLRVWAALPRRPVDRLRILLLTLTIAASAVVVPRILTNADASMPQRAIGLALLGLLGAIWIAGYRRGSFPRALLPLEGLLVIGAATPIGGPLNLMGLLVVAIAFRTTYRAGPAGLEPIAGYGAGLLIGLALAPVYAAPAELVYQPYQALGLIFGIPTWLLANALRSEEEVLRRQEVLSHAGAGLVAADTRDDIVAAGVAAACELLQRGQARLASPDEAPTNGGTLRLPLAGHSGSQGVLLLDGATPLQDNEREPLEALCTLIALRLEAYQHTQAQQRTAESRADRLAELNELKDDLLDSVSHELRSPLTSIRAYSELLLTYQDTAVQHEFLGIINSESERLARLVSDVLDLTHIQSGSFAWSMAPVDIPALLRDASRIYGPLVAREGLEFDLGAQDGLPPVNGDRDRLLQVIGNLLHNALKFTIRGSVGLAAYQAGQEVLVAVSDTGLGVPEAEREKIFDKFHQAGRAPEGKAAGTGLGLAICRQIVEHHGGRIWVTPAPRGGSVFTLALPALPAQAPVQGSPEPAQAPA